MADKFVGRMAELDVLREQMEEAAGGRPRLVLVDGPSGIGKTTLLAMFARGLTGWQVLSVPGDEEETRLAFGQLNRLLAATGHGPAGGDPFEAGAALLTVLGDMQEAGPVALLIDDATWADGASLRALGFALRRLQADRVLAVLAVRSDEPPGLPPGLLRHARDDGVHLALAGLATAEIRELVTRSGRGPLSRRAAERLHEHTAGSPLHLQALLDELPDAELRNPDGPLPAPSSFDRVVLAVLAECSERARRLVAAAAVLGLRTPLADAVSVGEVEADALSAMEEAVATRLVLGHHESAGWRIQFAHPLIRAAIYEDLSPAKRARLHERAAGIVDGPQVLVHRIAAATGPDPALATQLAAAAAADVEAGQLAQAADRLLAAARLTRPGDQRDGWTLDGVELLLRAGEVSEAAAHEKTIAALPDGGRAQLVAAQLAWLTGRHDQALALAHAAREAEEPSVAAVAAALIAQLLLLRGEAAVASEWAERALGAGTLPAWAASLARVNLVVGLGLSGRARDGLAALDGLSAPLTELPDWQEEEWWVRGALRLWSDDLTGATEALVVERSGRPWVPTRPYALIRMGYLAQVEFRAGSWDSAAEHAENLVSLVSDTEQMWLAAFAHSVAVFVPGGRGAWTEAQAHVDAAAAAAAALGDAGSTAYAANAAVHLASFRGEPMAVVAAAEQLRGSPAAGTQSPAFLAWPHEYAAALVDMQRWPDAEQVLGELGALAEATGLPGTKAVIARIRGQQAAARREIETARAAFAEALSIADAQPFVFEMARTRAAFGQFLRRAGERRAAAEQLSAALTMFARLRAAPFVRRCQVELAALGRPVERPAGRPTRADLTPQEGAVARLVCAGYSNREVAAQLVISVKTVGYHLANVYTKLGVHSRTQLALAMSRDES